jgi:hypothetical protein
MRLVRFSQAGAHGELTINAAAGTGSLAALEATGAANLAGEIIVELANPLDFSQGRPPLLSVAHTDSLGEQIQRAYPDTRVVKTLNTVAAQVMLDPARVPGHHSIFLAGEDNDALKPSRACSANSAGRRTRSSTSVASTPREPPRCTWRSSSRCRKQSTPSTSTSQSSTRSHRTSRRAPPDRCLRPSPGRSRSDSRSDPIVRAICLDPCGRTVADGDCLLAAGVGLSLVCRWRG